MEWERCVTEREPVRLLTVAFVLHHSQVCFQHVVLRYGLISLVRFFQKDRPESPRSRPVEGFSGGLRRFLRL